ncbi:hypothetical protein L798_12466 [Zootermopsis nevadensis]|uniref:Uncharacterized protein n=1 Tax=Zootermopsis nevadensis TaxID=136037 RepID=A0A067QWQ1_ZOONE|nr:hypothetical protein L798_12466 [Zootermopsis nevadensis]
MESIPNSASVEFGLMVFRSRLPMMLLTHSTTFACLLVLANFSATTMLDTTGHVCLMNL